MCKANLTSLFIHCILYLGGLGSSHPFLHVMHVCRGSSSNNLSSSWIYIVYTFILFIFRHPVLMNWQKGEEEFREFIYACLWFLFMHICVVYELSLNIFIVYCYAWVKGELLWSLNAYITSWVLSSLKRERLLDQKPINLILMMINSCSYNTNDLVFNKFQIIDQDLSRCLTSTKDSK